MKFFLFHLIDVIRGDAVFISDHRNAQRFLGLREFFSEENKDNWLTALKLDYKHEVKIVNKNHPRHKEIVKLINISLEHGIISKWKNLNKHGIMIMVYLFERLADQEFVARLRSEIEKKRNQISLNELSSVFLLIFFSLPISISVFVIELISHKLKDCKLLNYKTK